MPSKKFADGAEIYEHCRRIGKHYGLYDSAIFSTQVRELHWDEAIKRWRVSTNRGDDIRARFVVMASGPFHRPKLPGIPGIKDFQGHSFHSSRWDYEYTGGDSQWRTGQARRQARRGRRHRGDRHPDRPVPRPGRQAPLRLSAHTVVGRRAKQHADRSRVGEVAEAGLAEGAAAQLPRLDVRRNGAGPTGLRLRLLDRTRPQHRRPGPGAGRSGVDDPGAVHGASGRKKTTRSWSDCGAGSRTSSRTPRPPRRSSPTTDSCASGRAPTTSICRPSTART